MKNIVIALCSLVAVFGCTKKDETITQMVKFTVKPAYVQEFRKAQVNSLNNSLKEEGNLEMKLYGDDNNPTVFYVFSKWKNEEVYELHKGLPHSKELAPLFKNALQGAPDILRFKDTKPAHIDSKPLISTGNEQAIFISFKVKEGYSDRIIAQFEKHTTNSRKEAGNVFFDFYKVVGQENVFYAYENWKNSPEVMENHRGQAYVKETMTLLKEAVDGKLEEGIAMTTEYDENTLNESYTLEKLWEVENVVMPESMLSIPNHDFIYVSVINTYQKEGFISRYTKEGKLDTEKWATGINIPTGMAFYNGNIYVVDQSQVHVIDLETGKMVKTIPSEAKTLNDITIGKDGVGYVSDLATGRIFKLKDDKLALWLHSGQFPVPNGVLIDGNHLVVGSIGAEMSPNLTPAQYGSLFKINLVDKSVEVIKLAEKMGALDGVVKFKNGIIASDPMHGKIFYVTNYKKELICDFAGSNADIGIDADAQILYVPSLFHNKIGAYKIVKK
ncbi:quinol monooxygenase YgiN [Wenyingzhuangia heitensis]|uniref:Quinol monooxygenase YgiN n=1 Tax=Wenyingzhuangia heitensis TaxID=1487859 RepID=A0ABX0UB17_9FLAO|nr:antibiotic biosynthesis monooxygenase [Wenyingzhuangia heitensis]NIJ45483.1 quinol monooxygenase YgiN [Wenyingzhuangia heitensis]